MEHLIIQVLCYKALISQDKQSTLNGVVQTSLHSILLCCVDAPISHFHISPVHQLKSSAWKKIDLLADIILVFMKIIIRLEKTFPGLAPVLTEAFANFTSYKGLIKQKNTVPSV